MASLGTLAFTVLRNGVTRAIKHDVPDVGTNYILRALDDPPTEAWDGVRAFTASAGIRKDLSRAAGYTMSATGDTRTGEASSWRSDERNASVSPTSSAVQDLREAHWAVHLTGAAPLPWTGALIATIEAAVTRANARGADYADLRDLSVALIQSGPNRVVEALAYRSDGSFSEKLGRAAAGEPIDNSPGTLPADEVHALVARLEGAEPLADAVWAPGLEELEKTGTFTGSAPKHGLLGLGKKPRPLGAIVADEAVRQAVRLGADEVSEQHVTRALHAFRAAAMRSWPAFDDAQVPVPAKPAVSGVGLPTSWPSADQPVARRIASATTVAQVLSALT